MLLRDLPGRELLLWVLLRRRLKNKLLMMNFWRQFAMFALAGAALTTYAFAGVDSRVGGPQPGENAGLLPPGVTPLPLEGVTVAVKVTGWP